MAKALNIFRRCTVYLTAILTIFYLFSIIFTFSESGIIAKNFFLILGYSLILALAQDFFSIKKIYISLQYGLHYATLTVFFIFLYLLTGNYKDRGGSSLFVATVLFTVGYSLVMIPILIIKAKKSKKNAKNAPSTYRKIYN